MIRSFLFFILLLCSAPTFGNDLFLNQLDLNKLGTVASFDQGRVKSLDSLAASVMKRITGARTPTGTSNLAEMLDLAFRSEAWSDRPCTGSNSICTNFILLWFQAALAVS